jgi:hypothetical protein
MCLFLFSHACQITKGEVELPKKDLNAKHYNAKYNLTISCNGPNKWPNAINFWHTAREKGHQNQ